MTLRDEILETIKQGRVHGPYTVPAINKDVWIREVTVAELDRINELDKRFSKKESTKLAHLAVLACVDEQGNQIFEDKDAAELKRLPLSALLGIVEEFNKCNGFSDDDGGLEKN